MAADMHNKTTVNGLEKLFRNIHICVLPVEPMIRA